MPLQFSDRLRDALKVVKYLPKTSQAAVDTVDVFGKQKVVLIQ